VTDTIYVGSDHAGFRLKESMKRYLDSLGVSYEDLGAHRLNKSDDYPIYAAKVARKVSHTHSMGILFCGSSQGVSIAANKIKGIRAVAVNSVKDAQLTRLHNDANILCLSGWNTSRATAEKIIKAFLFTLFSGEERHKRRIKQIAQLE
jgi:ribose 5-phosphate isomerase B